VADRSVTAPAHPFRWLVGPTALGTLGTFLSTLGTLLLSATTSLLRRRREPSLPRMSEEWLRNLDHDSGRRLDWRDSW
jgi:hypothetical protein